MTDNAILQGMNTEPYLRRLFFERLAEGVLPPEQLDEGARQLGMDRPGQSYAVAVLSIPPEPSQAADYFSGPAAVRGELMAHFLKYSEYVAFPWGPAAYAAVLHAGAADMPGLVERCVGAVRAAYAGAGSLPWHLAVTVSAEGLKSLPALLREASQLWALRYFYPAQHIFLGPFVPPAGGTPARGQLQRLDPRLADPSAVRAFMEQGRTEEIPAFVDWYVQTALDGAGFLPLRHYGIVATLLAAGQYVLSLGLTDDAVREMFTALEPTDWNRADLASFLTELLSRTLSLRADAAGPAGHSSFSAALEHIRGHFTSPDLSLEEAARAAGMSPAYLSSLFRRKTGLTFTDYVAEQRVALARRLLLATDRRPGQIAEAVGYRDRHYFSVVFKKVQGCTPTQFRAKNRR